MFKFVSLVGDCEIFLSTKNKFPNEKNFEEKLKINN